MALRRGRGSDKRNVRYQLSCPGGGSGTCSMYGVFDGISLCLVDVRAPRVTGIRGMRPSPDAILIYHCRLGSERILYGGECLADVREGETVILRANEGELEVEHPEGYYNGAFLRMSLRSLTLSSRHGMSEFGVDLKGLVSSIALGGACVRTDNIDMTHTFSEIYNLLSAAAPNLGYLRLKAFELLVLLGVSGPNGGMEDSVPSSLFVGRVQVAYRAQQVMTRRLSDPIGVEALAKQCEVSPTVLKESFRKTFGVPVGTWYRAYRIHRACDLLRGSDMPVAEVACAVGYASASKFSRAFADVEGMTPSVWRHSQAEDASMATEDVVGADESR